MLIASPNKKEISIPLEPIINDSLFEQDNKKNEDFVNIHPRTRGQNDMITQVFGQATLFDTNVYLIGLRVNFQHVSSITHLIELAEEKTGCTALIVSLDRRLYKDSLSTLLRAFMYLGFEMVDPVLYGQEPGYILVGYEL
ncbi:hypothetical protein RO3G_05175 [Rhizopus delemar RA 99-880]|uniref:Uncharacterized protein n=1 Tax=Rhizopus delemar (strain RA 99-880 / ATCC MYA-4621 / FGSC 9543 / NRRL 43880) TaxID=246409 RepID=I1BW90_RHIO9|nr:hypothetical protein RO3G_05175 [Rhizopus delemar RA 99-880]|eukprot:EIE80470.1 hypothetical protein RO3G_05175 [Rhizopus delemar RA 99-880]